MQQPPSLSRPSPSPPASRRRKVLHVLLAAAILVVGASGAGVAVTRQPRDAAEAQVYRLVRTEGERFRYRFTMEMSSPGLPERTLRQVLDIDERVARIDPDGTATIRLIFVRHDVEGPAGGPEIPALKGESMTMRVAPDGTVLSRDSSVPNFPAPERMGMNEMDAPFPDHAIAPGDKWEETTQMAAGLPQLDMTMRYVLHRVGVENGLRIGEIRGTSDDMIEGLPGMSEGEGTRVVTQLRSVFLRDTGRTIRMDLQTTTMMRGEGRDFNMVMRIQMHELT